MSDYVNPGVAQLRELRRRIEGAPPVATQYAAWGTGIRPSNYLPAILGRWLVENWFIVKGTDGFLYRWVENEDGGGVYVNAETDIGLAVELNHGNHYRRGRAEDVKNWLRMLPEVSVGASLPDGFLNVRNGVLDWRRGELLEGGPQWLTTIQIPVRWVGRDEVKRRMERGWESRVDRFMREAVAADSLGLIWEMIGYVLSGTNKYQKAFLLYGPGGNGKSKLLAYLNALVGLDNITHNSLSALSSNRFRTALLAGKLANVCGDIGEGLIENTEMFKQLVGGDTVVAEHKGSKGFSFKNRAVLVFSANGFPKVTDHSVGYFDRFVFISMPVRFRGTDREEFGLEEVLCREWELELGLVRAVAGLKRVEERHAAGGGAFEVTESSAQLLGEYKRAVDSVADFVAECLVWGVGEMRSTDMYMEYQGYCARSGLQCKSAKRFWKDFRAGWGDAFDEVKRNGYPWVLGVRVAGEAGVAGVGWNG